MNAEERAAVDGFHRNGNEGTGETAYQEVMARQAYYLSELVKEVPLLASSAT